MPEHCERHDSPVGDDGRCERDRDLDARFVAVESDLRARQLQLKARREFLEREMYRHIGELKQIRVDLDDIAVELALRGLK